VSGDTPVVLLRAGTGAEELETLEVQVVSMEESVGVDGCENTGAVPLLRAPVPDG
jgi:hypothetical protein